MSLQRILSAAAETETQYSIETWLTVGRFYENVANFLDCAETTEEAFSLVAGLYASSDDFRIKSLGEICEQLAQIYTDKSKSTIKPSEVLAQNPSLFERAATYFSAIDATLTNSELHDVAKTTLDSNRERLSDIFRKLQKDNESFIAFLGKNRSFDYNAVLTAASDHIYRDAFRRVFSTLYRGATNLKENHPNALKIAIEELEVFGHTHDGESAYKAIAQNLKLLFDEKGDLKPEAPQEMLACENNPLGLTRHQYVLLNLALRSSDRDQLLKVYKILSGEEA